MSSQLPDMESVLRPRQTNNDDVTTPLASLQQPQTTYFLSDDHVGGVSLPRPSPHGFRSKILSKTNLRNGHGHTRALSERSTNQREYTSDAKDKHRAREDQPSLVPNNLNLSPYMSPSSLPPDTSSPDIINRVLLLPGVSRPETPSTQYTSSITMASTISSPSSRDEFEYGSDGMMSQVLLSGEEDEVVHDQVATSATPAIAASSSMFVMPTIPMPSRKPFTDKGKTLGRFKVLIAGAQGKCPHFMSNYQSIRLISRHYRYW